MSAFQTNPILAATAWQAVRYADRRISAGFVVEAAGGAPGLPSFLATDNSQHMRC